MRNGTVALKYRNLREVEYVNPNNPNLLNLSRVRATPTAAFAERRFVFIVFLF